MNREDILRMGRQAGSFIELAQEKDLLWLERFAALVASAERESCAKVCQDIYNDPKGNDGYDCYYTRPYLDCATAIRARGQA